MERFGPRRGKGLSEVNWRSASHLRQPGPDSVLCPIPPMWHRVTKVLRGDRGAQGVPITPRTIPCPSASLLLSAPQLGWGSTLYT